MFKHGLSKYQSIIAAVALFLVVDMGVLVMNFIIASQIQHDAVAVNLAGRQRMLSQRMAKALYQIEDNARNGQANADRVTELKQAFSLFDSTLTAFIQGGDVKGGDGELTPLAAVTDPAGKAILATADAAWRPYRALVDGALREPTADALHAAVNAAAANNLKLLKLMNDLTTHVEKAASSKAQTLRYVQAGGMMLAILNFFLILFHFMKQLRRSDAALEEAKQETDQILLTVNEGLFLLGRDLRIGTQYSKILERMFERENLAHQPFLSLLNSHVPERTLQLAKDYVGLLLERRVNANLISDLNPLNRVEVSFQGPGGSFVTKHLDFRFRRVVEDDELSHILVTVADTSEQVRLQQDLAHANDRAEQQIKMVTELLLLDPAELPATLDAIRGALAEVNDILRQPAHHHEAFVDKLNRIYRIVHRVKGDAGAVGLSLIESYAHQVEDTLAALAQQATLSGNDFIPATVQLERLLAAIDNVEDMVGRLGNLRQSIPAHPAPPEDTSLERRLAALAERAAARSGKLVRVVVRGLEEPALPEPYRHDVQELAQQLVRNAVAHGIEPAAKRETAGKPGSGLVSVLWHRHADGRFELTVEDDGAGISLPAIRERLRQRGLTAAEIDAMSEARLIQQIFTPGFTTRRHADEDAGRGVGLDAVRAIAEKLGGRINLNSRPGQSTRFRVLLPGDALPAQAASVAV